MSDKDLVLDSDEELAVRNMVSSGKSVRLAKAEIVLRRAKDSTGKDKNKAIKVAQTERAAAAVESEEREAAGRQVKIDARLKALEEEKKRLQTGPIVARPAPAIAPAQEDDNDTEE